MESRRPGFQSIEFSGHRKRPCSVTKWKIHMGYSNRASILFELLRTPEMVNFQRNVYVFTVWAQYLESWNSRIARIDALSNYKSFGDNCITDTSLNNFNTAWRWPVTIRTVWVLLSVHERTLQPRMKSMKRYRHSADRESCALSSVSCSGNLKLHSKVFGQNQFLFRNGVHELTAGDFKTAHGCILVVLCSRCISNPYKECQASSTRFRSATFIVRGITSPQACRPLTLPRGSRSCGSGKTKWCWSNFSLLC